MGSQGTTGKALVTVQEKIQLLVPRVADLLPKYMDAERFIRVARLIVSQHPDLADPRQTEPLTVLASVMDAARLGLELGREAHLVRYKQECKMLPDYRGYQKLALETGALRVIEPRVVYKGDAFEYEEGTNPHVTHRPDLSPERADRADNANVLAFYVVAFFKDGTATFLVRTPEQINHIMQKTRSRDKSGKIVGPWVTDWQSMGMKTVIKELCDKRLLMLPNAEKLSAAIELDNRAETGEIQRPVDGDELPRPFTEPRPVTEQSAEEEIRAEDQREAAREGQSA